ncbi:Spy/CpxP family protein refolding chaperone [Alteromonas gracilis]|uniref:Spy/CpxP family protein refolding chaperone n=1 Tax=Alteromonas gracilis TaxID=1479524 RepID=UPI003735B1C0
MKKFLIASASIAAMCFGSFAMAQMADHGMRDHEMRNHEMVRKMGEQLRGLDLSDAQREEIKALVASYKEKHPRHERRKSERPNFDIATASDAQITAFVQTQFEQREAKHFALSKLRHDIFNVLDESQQAKVLDKQAKREAKGDKWRSHTRNGGDHKRNGSGYEGAGFKGLELSDTQIADIEALRDTFKDTAESNRETMRSFKDAQRQLIQSANFSQDAWSALVTQYEEQLINAGVERIKHRQAMFAVLTDEQQATLNARKEEERSLRQIFRL